MSDNNYTLEQIVEMSGITQRNVKFWCSTYNIKPKKIGRSNYYSEKQYQLLKLVKYLTDTAYFSQKFIKLIVDFNLNPDSVENSLKALDYNLQKLLLSSSELSPVNFNITGLDIKTITDDDFISSSNDSTIVYDSEPSAADTGHTGPQIIINRDIKPFHPVRRAESFLL